MRFVLALLLLFAVSCTTTNNYYYYCCTPSEDGSCCGFVDTDGDGLPDARGECCDEECSDDECCDDECCGDECSDDECEDDCGEDCCDEEVEQVIVFSDSDSDGLPDTRVLKVSGHANRSARQRREAVRVGDVLIDVLQVTEDHEEHEHAHEHDDTQAQLEAALRELERAVRALQEGRERKMR